MKKTLLILLVAVAAAGCKKERINPTQNALEGKWVTQRTVLTVFENGIQSDQTIDTTFTANDFIVFKNDATATSSIEGIGLEHFKCVATPTKVKLTKITNSSVVQEYTIKMLNGTDLIMEKESQEVSLGITFKSVYEVTLKKI